MWVTCFYGARVATVEMAMDQRVQDMFSASPRPLRGLVIVPYLTMMLAFPAAAQTNSDSETQALAPSASRPSPSQSVDLPVPIK
jgi:hypothetical protein